MVYWSLPVFNPKIERFVSSTQFPYPIYNKVQESLLVLLSVVCNLLKELFSRCSQHQACAVVLKSECKGTAFTNNLQTFPILFWAKSVVFPFAWQKRQKTHYFIINKGWASLHSSYLQNPAQRDKSPARQERVTPNLFFGGALRWCRRSTAAKYWSNSDFVLR